MDLADILGNAQIVPDLKATNRWEAIDELIGNLVTTGKIQPGDRDAVTAAVKKRETSMSTGIGFGIGIPHASTDLIFEVVGAAYAFHVTLTFYTLKTRQSDITSQGYLFSAVVIFLGNVCVLLFGIPLLTKKVGILNSLGWWAESTGMIFHWLQRVI